MYHNLKFLLACSNMIISYCYGPRCSR